MVITDENSTSTYKFYKTNFTSCVELQQYKAIILAFTNLMFKKALEGDEVTVPAKLGEIFIRGTKRKIRILNGKANLPPNWKATKELRESNPQAREKRTVVYYTNEETGGVSYSFKWSKNRVPLINKGLMSFRLTKGNKRVVKQYIDKGQEYFIQ